MWDVGWNGMEGAGTIVKDDMGLRTVWVADAAVNVNLTILIRFPWLAISVLPRGDNNWAPPARKARTSELRRQLQRHQKFRREPRTPASHPQHGRTHFEDR